MVTGAPSYIKNSRSFWDEPAKHVHQLPKFKGMSYIVVPWQSVAENTLSEYRKDFRDSEPKSVNIHDLSEKIEVLEEFKLQQNRIIDSLQESILKLESAIKDFTHIESVDLRSLTSEEIRKIILDEISTMDNDECLYPSDIAFKYDLSIDSVENVMDELVSEGILK